MTVATITQRSKCPITRAISRLKQFAGMPVLAIVKWVNGKPDFRQIDERTCVRHYRYKLCSFCGTKLKLACYWIGGEACANSHYFADGLMHQQCAELSMSLCPFLNGTKPTYHGDDVKPMPVQTADERPAKMYLLRGLTSAIEWHQLGATSLALYAGKQLTLVKKF